MRRGVRLGSHAAAQAIGRWHNCYYDGPDDDDDCDEIEEEEEERSAEDALDREMAEAEDDWEKRQQDARDREREAKKCE